MMNQKSFCFKIMSLDLFSNFFIKDNDNIFELNNVLELIDKNQNPEWELLIKNIIKQLWTDKTGRKLLRFVLHNKVKFHVSTRKYSYATTNVYLRLDDLKYLSDSLFPIMVVIHEMSHALYRQENAYLNDSFLEEISVTMLGYQIASRIINGKELSKEQLKRRCDESFISFTRSKIHNYLQSSSDFLVYMKKKYGIKFPYEDLYNEPLFLYGELAKNTDILYLQQFQKEIEKKLIFLQNYLNT